MCTLLSLIPRTLLSAGRVQQAGRRVAGSPGRGEVVVKLGGDVRAVIQVSSSRSLAGRLRGLAALCIRLTPLPGGRPRSVQGRPSPVGRTGAA